MGEVFKPGKVRGAGLAKYSTVLALIPVVSLVLALLIHVFLGDTALAILIGPLAVIFVISAIGFAIVEIPVYLVFGLENLDKAVQLEYVLEDEVFAVKGKKELAISYANIESVATSGNREYSTVSVIIPEYLIRNPVYILTNIRDENGRKLAYVIGPENREDFIGKIAAKGVKVS